MEVTKPAEPNYPQHPQVIFDSRVQSLLTLPNTRDERDALQIVIRLALPAPNIKALIRASTILFAAELVDRDTYRSVYGFATRNSDHQDLAEPRSMNNFPYFYAIQDLFLPGRTFGQDGVDAVRLLVRLGAKWPDQSQYSPSMYYKHAAAYRLVCLSYWKSLPRSNRTHPLHGQSFSDRLETFVNDELLSESLPQARHKHLILTKKLLDGDLFLGGAMPRAKVPGRKRHDIDSEVLPSPTLLSSIENATTLNSAKVEEQWLDDEGVHAKIDYPDCSTVRDRHRIDGHVQNGFARTNVRTMADMSSCSLVTHRGYLEHARNKLNGATFALTWLIAFTGIDFRRLITTQPKPDSIPQNDEILVSLADSSIQYKILRRYERDDPSKYKSCGIFRLPVPKYIASGLDEIARLNTQLSCLDGAKKLASKYSRANSGLTPTLTRLRSGARTHFAPLGLTELEFAVVSGRVPPAIKAISAYYPHSSVQIAERFSKAYEKAFQNWCLSQKFEYDCPFPKKQRRDAVLCKPDRVAVAFEKLLLSVAERYQSQCGRVVNQFGQVDVDQLIDAINLHELACYSLQELGAGLRPTGEVAKFSAVNSMFGGMTVDKASRLFSERSYSPITSLHWNLLRTCRENRTELTRKLRYIGKKLIFEEPNSDLAVEFKNKVSANSLIGARLTGANFRENLSKICGGLELSQKPNWLRRRAANHIGGKVPQWQADEFLGHRRVGREPLGRWSTAGPIHFFKIRQHLASLHKQTIPGRLLVPALGNMPTAE